METVTNRSNSGDDLASMLASEPRAMLEISSFAHGFGGLHGGLAMAMVASSMQHIVPAHSLRSITGQFHRTIRETFAIESRLIHSGRSAAVVQATGSSAAGACLTATAIFGSDQGLSSPFYAPTMPDVPGPDSIPALHEVDGKVPVLSQVDLRPVGSIRPYSGATDPTMMAWLRVRGRAEPVDVRTLLFLLDALPPSYSAVLTQLRPVPTLEFSAHISARVASSRWVLVRARTVRAGEGGWVTELIDAWDSAGEHLGSAQQLRLAMDPIA